MNKPEPPPKKTPPEEPLSITMDGNNVDGDDWNKNPVPPGAKVPDVFKDFKWLGVKGKKSDEDDEQPPPEDENHEPIPHHPV